MTTGAVTVDLEAVIRLLVAGTGEKQRQIEAVIDTGFSGYLTLPTSVINSLQLVWLGREQGILADGRVELFDVYRAVVIWDGLPRAVEVGAAETEPLLGMSLLAGHEVKIRVVAGGEVTIAALS